MFHFLLHRDQHVFGWVQVCDGVQIQGGAVMWLVRGQIWCQEGEAGEDFLCESGVNQVAKEDPGPIKIDGGRGELDC